MTKENPFAVDPEVMAKAVEVKAKLKTGRYSAIEEGEPEPGSERSEDMTATRSDTGRDGGAPGLEDIPLPPGRTDDEHEGGTGDDESDEGLGDEEQPSNMIKDYGVPAMILLIIIGMFAIALYNSSLIPNIFWGILNWLTVDDWITPWLMIGSVTVAFISALCYGVDQSESNFAPVRWIGAITDNRFFSLSLIFVTISMSFYSFHRIVSIANKATALQKQLEEGSATSAFKPLSLDQADGLNNNALSQMQVIGLSFMEQGGGQRTPVLTVAAFSYTAVNPKLIKFTRREVGNIKTMRLTRTPNISADNKHMEVFLDVPQQYSGPDPMICFAVKVASTSQ